ncbi:MAG TPA: hypothetical protein VMG82_03685 [Candidatus Sulfotelmatobacter sp.]|nr:hypothetical protein [Candidatus Sulfotelmatobacter sp.]
MDPIIPPVPFAICMLAGMLLCLEIGRRLGKRSLAKDPHGSMSGTSTLQGAVFSLFGLLVGFTFSGAPARLDDARHLIQKEANAIGTAYLRLDLLPPGSQAAIREKFRNYVDSRVATFRKLPDFTAARAELSRSEKIQADIWKETLAASHLPDHDPDALKLLVPSLNEMFDAASMRTTSRMMHPPMAIFVLLFSLALVCSLLAGHALAGSKQRSWLHIAAFAVVYVISVYVILEIEYPRLGSFSVLETRYDQVLVDVRESMK